MKKLVLIAALGFTVLSFAQKDELKTLRKIYDKDKISQEQLEEYKSALTALSSMSLDEDNKVYADYYAALLPLSVVKAKGSKATMMDIMGAFKKENLSVMGDAFKTVLDYEKKEGKEKYTKDILELKELVTPNLKTTAFDFNSKKEFKRASNAFYSMYLFDKEDVPSLENAAITAVQAEDMELAELRYKDLLDSGYTGEGTSYLATNIASGTEESFNSLAQRAMFVKAGSHEKPRTVKNPSKRPEFARMYAMILAQNKKDDLAMEAYKLATELNPTDAEMRINQAALYYTKGDMVTYKKILEEALKRNIIK